MWQYIYPLWCNMLMISKALKNEFIVSYWRFITVKILQSPSHILVCHVFIPCPVSHLSLPVCESVFLRVGLFDSLLVLSLPQLHICNLSSHQPCQLELTCLQHKRTSQITSICMNSLLLHAVTCLTNYNKDFCLDCMHANFYFHLA